MSSLEESRQLIDDLLGQIGVDEEKSAHIRQAADLSLGAIEAARRATATSPMPEGTDLVGFGSLARFELTPKSDLDYLFIGQGCEPAVDLQLVDDVRSSLIEGMTVSRPGSSGIFGGSVDIDELVEVIGLDRDSNTNTTRRVLFLEESVSLARPEVHDRALQALLGRYLAANRGSRRIPRFLINDVIRYWRTIAVDYQAKSEGDEPKALRYLKLLIPRKLCYVAAIEPLFELNAVELIDEDERLDFLVSKYRRPSIVRLLQLMDVLVTRDPDSRKNVERVVGVLDDYTGKASDPRWRRRVELDGHSPDRKSSDSYGQMRQQGKELHSILGALLSGPVMGKFSREYMLLRWGRSAMGFRATDGRDCPCEECGFELWEPIVASQHSRLGLYNDDRFPGRCILVFRDHVEGIEELPMDSALGYLRDIQLAVSAIKKATNAVRVNVSLLGNRDPHLHAHLIPRFPEREEFPDCSPWNDRRPKGLLGEHPVAELKDQIRRLLLRSDTRKPASRSASARAFEGERRRDSGRQSVDMHGEWEQLELAILAS